MHSSLKPYLDLVEQGYIAQSISPCKRLVLFNYTPKTTFDKFWTKQTRNARGIIFEIATGKLVSQCLKKFYNINEMPETQINNLPDTSFTAYAKEDGSFGNLFCYDGEWKIATRGSFTSEQAIKAIEILTKYDISAVAETYCLWTEIIYPANKIVVNYGDEEKLVLLGGYDLYLNRELNEQELAQIAESTGIPLVKSYPNLSIDDMIKLQATIPKDQEGWVVKYENGLRLKVKGDAYLRIHKIVTNLSPLSLWESMEKGEVPLKVLQEIPEEFRGEWEIIVDKLVHAYEVTYADIGWEVKEALEACGIEDMDNMTNDDKRKLGIWIKENKDRLKHGANYFEYLAGRSDKYVMKLIRPTGNKL